MSSVKYFPIVSYINEELKFYLFSKYNSKSYMIYEEALYEGDITKITSELKFKARAERINKIMLIFEKKFNIKFSSIIPIIETKTYYTEKKKFVTNFKEKHEFTQEDIDKILTKAKTMEIPSPTYVVGAYKVESTQVDNIIVQKAVGTFGKQISLNGELVIIDSDTYYPIDKVVGFSKYDMENIVVVNYMYRYLDFLEIDDAIIDFKSDKTRFSVKKNNRFQNYSIPFGIGHIFENTYKELAKSFDPKEVEQALRFLQESFCLEIQDYDLMITKNISLNDIISVFSLKINDYANMFITQLRTNDIKVKKLYCKESVYDIDEWVNFLSDNTKLKIEKLKFRKYNNIQKTNLILNYCVENIEKTQNIN